MPVLRPPPSRRASASTATSESPIRATAMASSLFMVFPPSNVRFYMPPATTRCGPRRAQESKPIQAVSEAGSALRAAQQLGHVPAAVDPLVAEAVASATAVAVARAARMLDDPARISRVPVDLGAG